MVSEENSVAGDTVMASQALDNVIAQPIVAADNEEEVKVNESGQIFSGDIPSDEDADEYSDRSSQPKKSDYAKRK